MCRICSKILKPVNRTDEYKYRTDECKSHVPKIDVLHLIFDVTLSLIKVGIIPSLNIGHLQIKQNYVTTKLNVENLDKRQPIQYEQDEIHNVYLDVLKQQYEQDEIRNDYLDVLKQPKKENSIKKLDDFNDIQILLNNEYTELNTENHNQKGETLVSTHDKSNQKGNYLDVEQEQDKHRGETLVNTHDKINQKGNYLDVEQEQDDGYFSDSGYSSDSGYLQSLDSFQNKENIIQGNIEESYQNHLNEENNSNNVNSTGSSIHDNISIPKVEVESMALDDDKLPDRDAAKGFYAKYEPKEVLGRGGCSVVRRCIEKETGQQYAAKIIDLSDSTDVSVKDATLREIEILRMVAGHPYIIELHDVYESNTFIFLVFELCENGELFDHLTTVVTLSEKKTKIIMRQLFEALAHVHGKAIVHRDLKPENILLDDNYNIKLTDFGFAKVLNVGETLSDVCGTPGYLAPEVLRVAMYEGQPGYTHAVDLWACGVIMYTLLVGCPPFWHRKQMVMIRNIMEGKYSFQSPEWDDITDAPKDLISKLLVVDPSKRYTVQEALCHNFFQIMHYKGQPFNPRRKFQFGIMCVRSMIRIQRLRYTPEPVSLAVTRIDPYRIKALRKVIDNCAFRVYGHWVKKGEGQDRAALFQNFPKVDYSDPPESRMLVSVNA